MVWAGRDDLSDFSYSIDLDRGKDGLTSQVFIRHLLTGPELWLEPEKLQNQHRDGEIYFLFGPGPAGDWLARYQIVGDGPRPLEQAAAAGITFASVAEKNAYLRKVGMRYVIHRPIEAVGGRPIPWDEDLVRIFLMMVLIHADRHGFRDGETAPPSQVRFNPRNLPKRLHRTLSTSERNLST